MLHILIHSVLFLEQVAAIKSTKKNGVFSGHRPEPRSLLEKSDVKTFILCDFSV